MAEYFSVVKNKDSDQVSGSVWSHTEAVKFCAVPSEEGEELHLRKSNLSLSDQGSLVMYLTSLLLYYTSSWFSDKHNKAIALAAVISLEECVFWTGLLEACFQD